MPSSNLRDLAQSHCIDVMSETCGPNSLEFMLYVDGPELEEDTDALYEQLVKEQRQTP